MNDGNAVKKPVAKVIKLIEVTEPDGTKRLMDSQYAKELHQQLGLAIQEIRLQEKKGGES